MIDILKSARQIPKNYVEPIFHLKKVLIDLKKLKLEIERQKESFSEDDYFNVMAYIDNSYNKLTVRINDLSTDITSVRSIKNLLHIIKINQE